ncbi:MAG: DUF4282 domain-containing protein [Candidatus Marinimicrobia bacterium]|nr:DUF4282 domain-containing protein [Candidatus Neomarinimicrobiota bacterium]
MDEMVPKTFFQSLFDFSFSSFVTIKIIKLIFFLALIGSVIFGLIVMFSGFRSGGFMGILGGLVFGPLVAILMSIVSRVNCELIIVAFRIAENTGKLVELKQVEMGTVAPAAE